MQFDQWPPRTAHQEHAHQLLIRSGERHRVKAFGVSGVCGPANHTPSFLIGTTYLLYKGRYLVGAGGWSVQIEQRLWIPSHVEILIKQDACACRDIEGRQKALIEAFSAYDVQWLLADARRAHGKQPERRAARQFLAFKKRACRSDGRWNRWLRISKFCLPLVRRQNLTLVVHQFQKVQMLLSGQVASLADVTAGVGCAAVDLQRDALHGFAAGHGFHLADNFVPATLKF